MSEEVVKHGRPWSVVAKFASYEEADEKRKQLLEEDTKHDVKVKRFSDIYDKPFVVKQRLKAEYLEKKKSNKKQKSK
tara:strand:- start:423 stop:653 length:231 start_codon:yes stop_codon:yes gene_type:complete